MEAFLNLAELRAIDKIPTSMAEWKEFLDTFIEINKLPILTDKGEISHEKAVEIAKNHYDKFKVIHDKNFQSDFDKMIEDIKRIEGKTHF